MIALLLSCPMCFGAAESKDVQAAKIGVAFLLGVVVLVLGGIAWVARVWARRAAALTAQASPQRQSS